MFYFLKRTEEVPGSGILTGIFVIFLSLQANTLSSGSGANHKGLGKID
jgi:hypothetical protein